MYFTFLPPHPRPIPEHYRHAAIHAHRHIIHHAAPQPLVEFCHRLGLRPKCLDEAVHLAAPGLAVLDGFTGLVVLLLYRLISADQLAVVPVVIILVLCHPRILSYELLYLIGQQVQICAELVPLLFQGFCIGKSFLQQDDAVKDICFVFDELIGGPNEDFPNIVLCQMQSLAVALELVVASVDGPAVLIGRVSDLCPVPAAALAAFDFPREAGRVQGLIGKRPQFLPPSHLLLHVIKGFLVDDWFVRIFNIIFGKFAPVLLPLFEDWIRHVFFLEKHIASIGNIGQDNLDVGIHPAVAIPGRDAFGGKFPFCFKPRLAVKEILEDASDNSCFLMNYHQIIFFPAISIDTEPTIGVPLLKLFLDTPSDIFTDGAALFLGKGSQDSHHQLPFTSNFDTK